MKKEMKQIKTKFARLLAVLCITVLCGMLLCTAGYAVDSTNADADPSAVVDTGSLTGQYARDAADGARDAADGARDAADGAKEGDTAEDGIVSDSADGDGDMLDPDSGEVSDTDDETDITEASDNTGDTDDEDKTDDKSDTATGRRTTIGIVIAIVVVIAIVILLILLIPRRRDH